MRARFAIIVGVVALVGAQAGPVRAACGPAKVCVDVISSLVGQIDSESITISWSTSHQDASVAEYRIYRYNCQSPMTCSTLVATIQAVGSCEVNLDFSYTDQPATPLSQWEYSVEVWKSDQSRACAYDASPEVAP